MTEQNYYVESDYGNISIFPYMNEAQKKYYRDLRKYLNSLKKRVDPYYNPINYLELVSKEYPRLYRGTDLMNRGIGYDYSLFAGHAITFAKQDYGKKHDFPIIEVVSIDDLLENTKTLLDEYNQNSTNLISFGNKLTHVQIYPTVQISKLVYRV